MQLKNQTSHLAIYEKIFIGSYLACLLFYQRKFCSTNSLEKTFEIRGIVKNQDKIPLAGLNLFFEGDELKSTIVSDENGAFSIKLPVGKYKITANAAVSENFVAFIETFDNNLNPTDFDLIIETNKFCCSQKSDGNITEVIKYVAPPYPAAALATRTMGEVIIAVKIDKEGKVISATAESGHPLLRATGEKIAKQWVFSSDESGTEREGEIIFAFIIGEKRKTDSFTKPNRLEVFAKTQTINTTSY